MEYDVNRHRSFAARLHLCCVFLLLLGGISKASAEDSQPVSYFQSEIDRFTRLAASGIPECQIEAAQGLYYLRNHRGEAILLPLIKSDSPVVRLHAVKALGVCGGRDSIPPLVHCLGDSDWEVRVNARDALERMTGQPPFDDRAAGVAWFEGSTWEEKEGVLLKQLANPDAAPALAALKAFRFIGSSGSEGAVALRGAQLGRPGVTLALKVLERIGTQKSIPGLVAACPGFPDAAWALTEIGGPEAESALLAAFPRYRDSRIDYMVNLDRLGSTKCGPHIPLLLRCFGLVIFRSRTDDLQFEPTAFQRVAANLLLRTGESQRIVELILAQCEGTRRDEDTPEHLRKILADMKPELAPGFVRNDGLTVTQPLAAMPHIIRDKRFAPRLIKLLDHPAYIVRIYATESLATLEAQEAVEPIVRVVNTPYPFPDPTSQASGKHFDRSKFVRWRGYVCIALGKLGGEPARLALEKAATADKSYRDIRYGSTVGLRFLRSPKSLSVLKQIAENDIIREVRNEATRAIEDIDIAQRLAAAGKHESK